jgi:hypothetical protein
MLSFQMYLLIYPFIQPKNIYLKQLSKQLQNHLKHQLIYHILNKLTYFIKKVFSILIPLKDYINIIF